MIKNLLEEADRVVAEELERANKDFPLFCSNHEGYAVLLEEVEELQDEMDVLKEWLRKLWAQIKDDDSTDLYIERLRNTSRRLYAEAVQVAAMVDKFEMSERKRNEKI